MTDPTTVEALLAYAGLISEAALRSGAASELQHQFVHGDKETVIQTESGPLPSLAKWKSDTDEIFEDVRVIVDTNFRRESADPSTRSDGSPLETGDEYFNTVELVKRVWNGAIWYTPNADGQAIQSALANPIDSAKGVGMVAHKRSAISNSPSSLSRWLDGDSVNLWELVGHVVNRPTEDPSTWDWLPALNKWVDNVKTIPNYSRSLRIPKIAGGYGVSSTWLVPLSICEVRQEAPLKLTSTLRQCTILFAADFEQAPASTLFGIDYIVSRGMKIDGNGAAMTFDYAHGDGSDNHSTIRFNRVDTFTARGGHATNGPIDSFSVRQCRNWLVEDFEFSHSREDNGFSATTDWAAYSRGDWDTYGFGTVINCRGHHCKDFGMTAFNCSGVRFVNNTAWKCDGGFSYEDSYAAPRIKYFDGGFFNCHALQCLSTGFYVQCNGVKVDDECSSYQIKGTPHINTDGLFENGVVVSGCTDFYVGGKHRECGRSGVAIFNGWGASMAGVVAGEYSGNGSHGIRARGISRLLIKPGTLAKSNGLILIGEQHGDGIYVSNSGGAIYLEGSGALIASGLNIESNGANAMTVDGVYSVTVDDNSGANNCVLRLADGIKVTNAGLLYARNNVMRASSGLQRSALVVGATVGTTWVWGNRGPGSTAAEVSNGSPSRKGMDPETAISIGAFTPMGALPSEGGWTILSLSNALSTLVDRLQRTGTLNKN